MTPPGTPPLREQKWPRTEFGHHIDAMAETVAPDEAPAAHKKLHRHVNVGDLDVRRYRDGQFIFREHETGDLAFILQSGTVELIKRRPEGDVVIDRLGRGALFGEFALIDGGPRLVSARAVGEDVRVAVVNSQRFRHKIDEADPFLRGLLEVLSSNVRLLVSKIS